MYVVCYNVLFFSDNFSNAGYLKANTLPSNEHLYQIISQVYLVHLHTAFATLSDH
jgi:hypothetical protein